MASIAALVEAALKAANVPFVGVSLVDNANRATWSVHFKPEATDQDRATAQTVINTVDVSQAAQDDADAVAGADQKDLKAAVMGLYENWANPLMTKAQLRNRIIAIRKTL